MDYFGADRELHHKRWGTPLDSRKLENNTHLKRLSEHEIGLLLHNTYIARFFDDYSVILDTEGWRTRTTKDRLNYVSDWHVFSGRHHRRAATSWWLRHKTYGWNQPVNEWVPFFDGIHVHQRTGEVLSADEELERAIADREPGPSDHDLVNAYIGLFVEPDAMAAMARRAVGRGAYNVTGRDPFRTRHAMLDSHYFGLDVLYEALRLDAAVRGEFDRALELELEALTWLDLMERGEQPPRVRQVLRRYLTHLKKEAANYHV